MLDALTDTLLNLLRSDADALDAPLAGDFLPMPVRLDIAAPRLKLLFERAGFGDLPDHRVTDLAPLARRVRFGAERSQHALAWIWVDRILFKLWAGPHMLRHMRCPRCWHAPSSCPHILALILALAWHTPEARAFLTAPLWEAQLLPCLASAATASGAPARAAATPKPRDTRHKGHVRYTLHPPTQALTPARGDQPIDDLRGLIERQLVRYGRRDGRPLKPIRFPRTLDDARARVVGLTDADADIDRALMRLRAFYEAFEHTTRTRQRDLAHDLIHACAADAVTLLARCDDVRFAPHPDAPITVHTNPLLPALQLDAPDASDASADAAPPPYALRWSPGVRAFFDLQDGFVLTEDFALYPLSAAFPASMRALLTAPLPPIPADDLDRFVQRFALRSPVPVKLDQTTRAPQTPDAFEPRLLLSEDPNDGALLLRLRFAYRLGDAIALANPDQHAAALLADLPEDAPPDTLPPLLQRAPDAEREALASLSEHTHIDLFPARLDGVDALDFLAETLPRLPAPWTPYGADALTAHRVVGTLTPALSLSGDLTWFDAQLELSVPDAPNAPKPALQDVLDAWRQGRRYHRLRDGTIARLPERWLQRHADAIDELQDLRKAARRKLGAFAAPMLASLLEDLAPDPALLPAPLTRWRATCDALADFQHIPPLALNIPIQATLRDYQRDGVRWLRFLRDANLGGILADDMGLGKTLQTLTLLADTHANPVTADLEGASRATMSLVVAPLSVLGVWAAEAARFTPSLRVHIHHGPRRGDTLPDGVDVVVTSTALARQDAALWAAHLWRYVVVDEAQSIKNPRSQTARAIRAIPALHRLALTGTPVENNLLDLWSLFHFVMPGFFGSQAAFTRRYARPIQQHQCPEATARLRARVKPFILRRLKDEVAQDLPPRQEQVLYCDLTPAQQRLYRDLQRQWRATVLSDVEAKGVQGATLTILEALTRLRQVCCHPQLLPATLAPSRPATSAKLTLLLDTLDRICASHHRALIFSQWPSLLRLVSDALKQRGLAHLYLDGSTRDRHTLQETWNAPDGPPAFLISLKAGGTGLNLTGADHVIHLDPWWNPAVEAQATDRAHRIGQTRPVVAYKLVARDTVEETILELQARKRLLQDAALNTGTANLVATLTRDDIEAVFAA